MVTPASFKVQFPEFAPADDTLVQKYIDDAVLLCPAAVWVQLTDQGVSYAAADALALSPFARELELSTDGKTVYGARLETLRASIATGGLVL